MKNNRTLWLIWGIALLPLGSAILAYTTGLPVVEGRNNRGELQTPVRMLEQWGGSVERHTGHWTLLLSVARDCDAQCAAEQDRLRAVHDALGRDADRVRIDIAEEASIGLGQGIWLVDPMGNLVLRYAHQQPAEDVLKDLRKLLKVSNLG